MLVIWLTIGPARACLPGGDVARRRASDTLYGAELVVEGDVVEISEGDPWPGLTVRLRPSRIFVGEAPAPRLSSMARAGPPLRRGTGG